MNITWKKHFTGISLSVLMVAGLVGCTSNSASSNQENTTQKTEAVDSQTNQQSSSVSYPITVSNYSINDGNWTSRQQVFEAAPTRVVANNQSTAELLIRLGLTDTMAGVAALYGETSEDIAEEFLKIPVLADGYVGKEVALGANPDLIIGRGDLFADAEWGVGSVDELNSLGIRTYIFNTCKRGATVDALFQDIEEIGRIFSVQDRASVFADSLHSRINHLTDTLSGVAPQLTYAYVSYSDGDLSVYSATSDTFQNDALNMINLDNAFKNAAGEITLEQLVSTNPDVLLISRYSGGPEAEKSVEEIYKMPALQSLSAVVNKQIYIIDFSQFWGYSYQILDGVEQLASNMYPDLIN